MKFVYYLARSYNDIDCRLPLLLEFSRDPNYSVTIIAIPTNGGLVDPKIHELDDFTQANSIATTSVYDFGESEFSLRFLARICGKVANSRILKKGSRALHLRLNNFLFGILGSMSMRRDRFIRKVLQKFNSSIVVTDEIIFHRGRSFFVDRLYQQWEKFHSFDLYAFSTGQDTYIDLWSDKKTWGEMPIYSEKSIGIPLLVPGPNDAKVMKAQLRDDVVIVGNTRFDRGWVQRRSELGKNAATRISKEIKSAPDKLKIVFMLSKLEYGVREADLVETINRCATLRNAVVIVKPHTRGMDFRAIGVEVSSDIVDGTDFASSDLIEWADCVLFTGSSVVFHALVLGKKVFYLKYCQRYETIFDDCNGMFIASSIDEVLERLTLKNLIYPVKGSIDSFLDTHIFNRSANGMVCREIKARIEADRNVDLESNA